MLKVRTEFDFFFFSSWNSRAEESDGERLKMQLPGKSRRHPWKIRLEQHNAEVCESCPAALLSKCQLVMCHLFKAANSTSASGSLCFPAPTKATGNYKLSGKDWPPRTSSQASHTLPLFCFVACRSAFRSRADQLCTSQFTAGWLGFKELPDLARWSPACWRERTVTCSFPSFYSSLNRAAMSSISVIPVNKALIFMFSFLTHDENEALFSHFCFLLILLSSSPLLPLIIFSFLSIKFT